MAQTLVFGTYFPPIRRLQCIPLIYTHLLSHMALNNAFTITCPPSVTVTLATVTSPCHTLFNLCHRVTLILSVTQSH